ncbi:uncharacterized protein TNCV_2509601 [Trichonephila clavipes]|nr:uncharacterized protein TNCV_2509601 [Trichonephila clavipes]
MEKEEKSQNNMGNICSSSSWSATSVKTTQSSHFFPSKEMPINSSRGMFADPTVALFKSFLEEDINNYINLIQYGYKKCCP